MGRIRSLEAGLAGYCEHQDEVTGSTVEQARDVECGYLLS
jgi:hypothetical protein